MVAAGQFGAVNAVSQYDGDGLCLVLWSKRDVVVGSVLAVEVGAAVNHLVGESVCALTRNGDGAVWGDAADLVAKGQHGDACPEAVVTYFLVLLIKSSVH